MFRTIPAGHKHFKGHSNLPNIAPQALPYPAKLIARRYNVHPRLAGVVAELVGYAVAQAEARGR